MTPLFSGYPFQGKKNSEKMTRPESSFVQLDYLLMVSDFGRFLNSRCISPFPKRRL